MKVVLDCFFCLASDEDTEEVKGAYMPILQDMLCLVKLRSIFIVEIDVILEYTY